MKRIYTLIAFSVLAVMLAACGGSGDRADSGGATGGGHSMPATSAPAGHNDQDVMFAQMMIPHHQQAVEMAKLAGTRASMPEVKTLATTIEGAQEPEIRTMTRWLHEWGAKMPSGGVTMGHGDEGIMSDADMSKLKKASGRAFDEMFLKMMIKHHQGAVAMARTEQQSGMSAPAKAMAANIVRTQSAEIAQMRQLLKK